MTSPCNDREVLRARVRADLKVYREAVKGLEEEAVKVNGAVEKAFKNARIAQDAYELARMRFEDHVESHGCDVAGAD